VNKYSRGEALRKRGFEFLENENDLYGLIKIFMQELFSIQDPKTIQMNH
jgi:hypothetical protein